MEPKRCSIKSLRWLSELMLRRRWPRRRFRFHTGDRVATYRLKWETTPDFASTRLNQRSQTSSNCASTRKNQKRHSRPPKKGRHQCNHWRRLSRKVPVCASKGKTIYKHRSENPEEQLIERKVGNRVDRHEVIEMVPLATSMLPVDSKAKAWPQHQCRLLRTSSDRFGGPRPI